MNQYEAKLQLLKRYMPEMKKGQPWDIYYAFDQERNFNRLTNAVDSYAGGILHFDHTTVLALCDATMFGSGKHGILFCTDGMYWKNYSSSSYVKYSRLQSVDYYDASKSNEHDKGIRFLFKDGDSRVMTYCNLNTAPMIAYIREMIDYFK